MKAVNDLSSDAFIAALKRFIAKRELPQKIYSDNATNIIGVNNELHELTGMFQSKFTRRTNTSNS